MEPKVVFASGFHGFLLFKGGTSQNGTMCVSRTTTPAVEETRTIFSGNFKLQSNLLCMYKKIIFLYSIDGIPLKRLKLFSKEDCDSFCPPLQVKQMENKNNSKKKKF